MEPDGKEWKSEEERQGHEQKYILGLHCHGAELCCGDIVQVRKNQNGATVDAARRFLILDVEEISPE